MKSKNLQAHVRAVEDSDMELEDDPIGVCVKQVQEVVERVQDCLKELHAELDYHLSSRYFSSWRTPYYGPIVDKLARLKSVLNARVDLLLKALTIHNFQ